ncbi:hypothetical protein DASB73_024140 [Starmerella bacillaris]|uniref:Actin n=1 Tax=Starmerella bacillaris TaxID=1247836 RepID=A0AAV5RJV8_STABA|nr:hypothetical protein DASB73_024140 [Starmerella bacillaris]
MEIPNQPLVIDAGSSTIRAGIAGDSEPGFVFPSYIGRVKHDRVMLGGLQGSEFVGPDAQENRGLLTLRYPIRRGVVTNWNDIEKLFEAVYKPKKTDVKGLHSEDHPILITEPPLNTYKNRQNMAELLFETFHVPAMYVAIPSVLSLYASGKTNGLTLDVGDGVSYCVPVFKGFAITNAILRSNMGGSDVTDYLQLLLRKIGINLMTTAEREIVKEIKENHSLLMVDGAKYKRTENIVYKLPDGQKVEVGKTELSRAPELLFKPQLIGSEESSISDLVSNTISRSDMDLRTTLYQTILLSGGTTETHKFGDRLLNELKLLSPPSTKLRIFAPPNRSNAAWTGGSILGGLGTFKKMWITAEEYAENPNKIHQFN